MSESIIDQAVDTIEVEKDSPDNILIVSEIYEVSGDIYFKSLLESDSIKVGSISDWVDKSESQILDEIKDNHNFRLHTEIENKIKNIKYDIDRVWDNRVNKFRLDYSFNQHNQLHKLYVPINNEIIENPVVYEIYDENGNFQAEGLKRSMGEELYKIETLDLFTDKLYGDIGIYTTEERSLIDAINNKIDENDSGFEQEESIGDVMVLSGFSLCIISAPFIGLFLGTIWTTIGLILLLTAVMGLYPMCAIYLTMAIYAILKNTILLRNPEKRLKEKRIH